MREWLGHHYTLRAWIATYLLISHPSSLAMPGDRWSVQLFDGQLSLNRCVRAGMHGFPIGPPADRFLSKQE
jgi:hypothetical protein